MVVRRRAVLALVLAAALPAGARPDPDDDADAYAEDDAIALVPRTAKLRLADNRTVVIEARYELDAFGPLPPPGASRVMPLPHDAVITGAVVHVAGRTQRLELVAAESADKRLEALNGPPTARGGRMSAVRLDIDGDQATLDLTIPRRTHVRLDLTLEVPTCFANDARHILIPPAWTSIISGSVTQVSGVDADALDDACGGNPDDNRWVAFASRELAKQSGGAQRIGTYGARVALGATDISRVEIALAGTLSEIPRDLYTVLVVDHSHSLTTEELETQGAVVAAYLRAAPRGRVQLVGYARHGRTLLPGWMTAAQATSRIDREVRALAPRNGSSVEAGLATAATLLANVTGTRRVLLFTDDRFALKTREDAATYAAALPAGTLVHVVSLAGFEPGLTRDDSHDLSALAEQTEGVAMRAALDDSGAIDAISLARPTSLDGLSVDLQRWTTIATRPCPEPFVEGSSCDVLGSGPRDASSIVIHGYLWGTKFRRVVAPDPSEGRSLARLLLSRLEELPVELVAPVQAAARAVNRAWSMLAMWGTGGYGDLETWGTIGTGRYGTTSRHLIDGIGHPGQPSRTPTEEVLAQLGPAVRRCKPFGTISVVVELTKEEIVDVHVTTRNARDASKQDCIIEAVWDAALVIGDAPDHVSVRVDVQP